MGYRLEVSELEYKFCGGKLYGYGKTPTKEMKSYKWLKENHYLDNSKYDNDYTTFEEVYGNPKIVMRKEDFKKFIELYNEDMNKASEEEGWIYGDKKDWVKKDYEKFINDDLKEVVLEWY